MPNWGEVAAEIAALLGEGDPRACDVVRRKYLAELHAYTGRNIILYATAWTQAHPQLSPELLQITIEDVQGLMQVVHGLKGTGLDLVLHSPGGSPGAAEALVSYLRSKFDNIRVLVPHAAMSAATMVACAGDEIVMGKHSFLGPTDPQLILETPLGVRVVPAQAIIRQFDLAMEQCVDPARARAWLPMLSQYGPDLLAISEEASEMSEDLVAQWLEKWMFAGQPDASDRALEIAAWLSTHKEHKSHERYLSRVALEARGLKIDHLEEDQREQDAVLSVFHATTRSFEMTPAVKIIENHEGKAFMKIAQAVVPVSPDRQGHEAPDGGPPSPEHA